MKRKNILIAAAIAAAISYSSHTYALKTDEKTTGSVSLSFVESENFRDIQYDSVDSLKGHKIVLASIEKAFVKYSSRVLPAGYELEVTVSDVDLAGDHSPLSSTFGDIRVLRDIFPPRIGFDYMLKDSNERIIESGTAKLVDMSYLYRLNPIRHSSTNAAPYISEMIERWSARDLKKLVATS